MQAQYTILDSIQSDSIYLTLYTPVLSLYCQQLQLFGLSASDNQMQRS